MKRFKVIAVGLALGGVGLGQVSTDVASKPVELETTISRLTEEGLRRKDPSYLLGATSLRLNQERSLRLRGIVKKQSQKATTASAKDLLTKAANLAVEQRNHAYVEAAAELAENKRVGLGDDALAESIRTKGKTARGNQGAVAGDSGRLVAGESVAYEVPYLANQKAQIAVAGQGLTVRITDGQDKEVYKGKTTGGQCVFKGTAATSTTYIVVISASAKTNYALEAK